MTEKANESDDQYRDSGAILPQQAACHLPGFVDLQIRSSANRIESTFPLDFRLEVDEIQLEIPRQQSMIQKMAEPFMGGARDTELTTRLRVRLKYCYVRCTGSGLAVRSDSKYRSAIELGEYNDQMSTSDELEAAKSNATGAKLKATLSRNSSGEAGFEHRVGNSFQARRKSERIMKVSQDLYEVEAVPGGWRIGDKSLGDPLKKDSCLDGQYFGRSSASYPSTCQVEFLPNHNRGSLNVTVTCRDGLHVQTANGDDASESVVSSAVAEMRNKIAAIRIEKEIARDAADASGEIVLLENLVLCIAAEER